MPAARRSALITDAQVRAKHAPGRKLSEECDGRGGGALVVRWGTGVKRWFYYRYTDPRRRQCAIPLNVETLAEARAQARAFAQRAREARGEGNDLRAVLDQEAEASRREERARLEAAEKAARLAERGTLRALLDAYVAYLERGGKQAAGEARRLFRRHVVDARPELAARQAAGITFEEFTEVLRVVVDQGHVRTAAKLRSYLRSAYALAIRAPRDASVPAALLGLGVDHNPVAATASFAGSSGTRDRALTDRELGYYAGALFDADPSPARDALLVALLLGGQRPTQLLRCVRGDADLAARTLTLRDGKGRRKVPRLHVLPLAPVALGLVAGQGDASSDAPLFSTDGERAIRIEKCEEYSRPILVAMGEDARLREAQAQGAGRAQLRDLRRTCETMMAALGVSSDTRAQIQSHGLGGVQARHYDRHSYATEKRDALAQWEAHVLELVRQHRGAPQAPSTSKVVANSRPRGRRVLPASSRARVMRTPTDP